MDSLIPKQLAIRNMGKLLESRLRRARSDKGSQMLLAWQSPKRFYQADLTKLAAITSTASEINITDGLTATTAELNQLDDKTVGGTNSDDIVDVASSQSLDNKTLEGGTYT